MSKRQLKNLFLSISICIVFAIPGNLIIGDNLLEWFTKLNHPWFSLPLWCWYIVGGLYYIMAIVILYRVFERTEKPLNSKAFWLTLGMIAGNEIWNLLFFGFRSTFLGFIGLIPFTVIVVVLYYELWKSDRPSAWLILLYIIWLGYDFIWAYSLWRMN